SPSAARGRWCRRWPRSTGTPAAGRPARVPSAVPCGYVAVLLARLLAVLGRGEEGEQLVAVAVELARADPLDGQELAPAAGAPLAQSGQGAVVEDHVGGDAVGLGPLAPPGPELLGQGALGAQAGPAGPGHPGGHGPPPHPRPARPDPVRKATRGLARRRPA